MSKPFVKRLSLVKKLQLFNNILKCGFKGNVVNYFPISLIPNRYTTVYTMFPVFSLVLDKDVKSEVAIQFPELYADLRKVSYFNDDDVIGYSILNYPLG